MGCGLKVGGWGYGAPPDTIAVKASAIYIRGVKGPENPEAF